MSFGGLKDKHASTTQFFSIKNGPQKNLDLSDIVVKYQGAITSPYDASHLAGNRFGIIIRNINSDQAKKQTTSCNHCQKMGSLITLMINDSDQYLLCKQSLLQKKWFLEILNRH
jgi:tRNA pseudouridine13 synthase